MAGAVAFTSASVSAGFAPKNGRKVNVVQNTLRLFSSSSGGKPKYKKYEIKRISTQTSSLAQTLAQRVPEKLYKDENGRVVYQGVHHVALLCQNLERALEFYQGVLGLAINPDRPHNKLPYRGAWLMIGPEMIHLMELPNPDPLDGRPEHGGRDRHFCIGVENVQPLVERLEKAGVAYTKSMSGRPAVFFRDPDMNCLEVSELLSWR